MAPRPIGIAQGDPGLRKSGLIAGSHDPKKVFSPCRDEGLQGFAVYHVPGSNSRGDVFDCLRSQVRRVEIESCEQNGRSSETKRGIGARVARSAGDTWYIERAAVPGFGCSERSPGRSAVRQVGRVDSQRSKDPSVDRGLEFPARQRHVLCMDVHPAVGRQGHEIGGTGTPGAIVLSDETCEILRLSRAPPGLLQEASARAEREVHQAASAALHLLRRHKRGRNRRPASGKRAGYLHLRRGGEHIGESAGQHKQASHKNQGNPGFPCRGLHREVLVLGKDGRPMVESGPRSG